MGFVLMDAPKNGKFRLLASVEDVGKKGVQNLARLRFVQEDTREEQGIFIWNEVHGLAKGIHLFFFWEFCKGLTEFFHLTQRGSFCTWLLPTFNERIKGRRCGLGQSL